MWRDRLKLTYRSARVQSALTAVKTPYVEEINPFLSRRIIETVGTLPDELRTDKRLYTEYVRERSADVPVATRSANPDTERLLGSEASKDFLRGQLNTDHARSVLGDGLIAYVLNELNQEIRPRTQCDPKLTLETIKRRVGSRLPTPIVKQIDKYTPVDRPANLISVPQLVFRLFIVQEMCTLLKTDSDRL